MNKPFYAQSGGIKPMDKPEQIAWFKEYINSPKNTQKGLEKNTLMQMKKPFKECMKLERLISRILLIIYQQLKKQIMKQIVYWVYNIAEKMITGQTSKYQYKIHDKKAGKIEITEKGLKASPHVVTHEISHGITDGTSKMPTKTIIDIIKRTRGNKPGGFNTEGYARKFSDGFFKNEKEFLDTSLSINVDTETYLKI